VTQEASGEGHLPRASDRVEGILSRMTLARKAAQMTQPERLHATPAEVGMFGVGSVLSGAGSCPGQNRPVDWARMNDRYWEASTAPRDDGQPAVPVLYGVDAVHGHNNVLGAVVFPHNIGLGAAGSPDLMRRIGRVTAREVLATGVDWTFAPTLAVAEDDRWGRTYESMSVDPRLVGVLTGAIVEGLRGSEFGGDGILACAKHWAGDGATTGGVDQGDCDRELDDPGFRRMHLAPYGPALDAGALAVMVSLSSIRGTPCHAHRKLITDVLKGEFGFAGFVVSDWNGVLHVDPDLDEAVVACVNAGIDLFMVPERWREFIEVVVRQTEAGRIPVERIDDAVRRILSVKEQIGLFDRPRPLDRPATGNEDFGCAAHRAVAREAVSRSLVLLKNGPADHASSPVLPLDPSARVLVTGRNADDRGSLCGGFTVEWQGVIGNEKIKGGTSIWEGVRDMAPGAKLLTADELKELAAPGKGDHGFDCAVVVVGEQPYAEGMGDIRDWMQSEIVTGGGPTYARSGESELERKYGELVDEVDPGGHGPGALEPYGDTLSLSRLHPEDLEAIRRASSLGVPVVTVLVSGRPLVVNEEMAASDAFVAAWLPGSQGEGVANALFGRTPFTGKLPRPWPATDIACNEPAEELLPTGYGLTTISGTATGIKHNSGVAA